MVEAETIAFGKLDSCDYFCFPKDSHFFEPGDIYVKESPNASQRFRKGSLEGNIWGITTVVVKLDPCQVSLRITHDWFARLANTDSLDYHETDGMVVISGQAFVAWLRTRGVG